MILEKRLREFFLHTGMQNKAALALYSIVEGIALVVVVAIIAFLLDSESDNWTRVYMYR